MLYQIVTSNFITNFNNLNFNIMKTQTNNNHEDQNGILFFAVIVLCIIIVRLLTPIYYR